MTTLSCSEKINLAGHYDPTQSFEVIDQQKPKDGEVKSEIRVNDAKRNQLLSWLKLNNRNWEPTHNTQAGLVIIHQKNFRLLLYRNNNFGVVIITDDEDKLHYYKKDFDVGELEFLN